MTTEEFLALCKANGLSIAEIDDLNIGKIIDYLYAYTDILKQRYGIDENSQSANNGERMATQADFDAFDL
jgi:hypothetical protein